MTGAGWYVALRHPWVDTGADEVLIAPPNSLPLRLAAPTVWVWRELEQPRSLAELCGLFLPAKASDRADVEGLLLNQLEVLIGLGLVAPSSAA